MQYKKVVYIHPLVCTFQRVPTQTWHIQNKWSTVHSRKCQQVSMKTWWFWDLLLSKVGDFYMFLNQYLLKFSPFFLQLVLFTFRSTFFIPVSQLVLLLSSHVLVGLVDHSKQRIPYHIHFLFLFPSLPFIVHHFLDQTTFMLLYFYSFGINLGIYWIKLALQGVKRRSFWGLSSPTVQHDPVNILRTARWACQP